MSDLMTLQDVADEARVSIHTVRDWRRKHLLRAFALPTGTIRIKREDFEAFIAGEVRTHPGRAESVTGEATDGVLG